LAYYITLYIQVTADSGKGHKVMAF